MERAKHKRGACLARMLRNREGTLEESPGGHKEGPCRHLEGLGAASWSAGAQVEMGGQREPGKFWEQRGSQGGERKVPEEA